MTTPSTSVLPASLAQGYEQFEQWRGQQTKRRRLPEDLWSLAVDLARQFGVSRTAKTLRLDHTKLKAKCQDPADGVASSSMAFLELQPDRGRCDCAIECERSSGQKIRIHLKGPQWPDLSSLCERLWDTQG